MRAGSFCVIRSHADKDATALLAKDADKEGGMGFNPVTAIGDAFDAGARALGDVAEQGGRAFEGALEAAKSLSPSDIGHTVLDGVGMIPVVGEVADLANAGWYAAEGNWTDAALSAGSMIPIAGNAVTAAKWGKRAVEAGTDVARTVERADDVADAGRVARQGDEAVDGARAGKADEPGQPDGGDGAGRAAKADLTTITRRQGRNEMEWQVDGEGRFVSGKAKFEEDFAGRKTRGSDEIDAQKAAAGRGVDGDQGGHMFAHRFVKDQGSVNLVPQNGDLNNRVWGRMEQEWGDWIASGRRVEVEIRATPAGADRPDAFRVTYDVVDPKSGKTVYSNSQRFLNEAGQNFEPVSAREMRNWKG
jgi:DNA/RNA non-specific endonuclease